MPDAALCVPRRQIDCDRLCLGHVLTFRSKGGTVMDRSPEPAVGAGEGGSSAEEGGELFARGADAELGRAADVCCTEPKSAIL